MQYSCEALIFFDHCFFIAAKYPFNKDLSYFGFLRNAWIWLLLFFTDVYCIGDWVYRDFSVTPQNANLHISYKTVLD